MEINWISLFLLAMFISLFLSGPFDISGLG